MTYFADLSATTQVDAGPHIRAVGWLSPEHPFPSGDVPIGFLDRLSLFSRQCVASAIALEWPALCGPHRCEFCGGCVTSDNFGVPAGELLYVAPEMIVHYVKAHGYCPPNEFMVAVCESPLPGSDDYRRIVAPFRHLQDQHVDRQIQQRIYEAGQWAFARGGTPDAVREAVSRFFGGGLPVTCDDVRRAMPTPEPGASLDGAHEEEPA